MPELTDDLTGDRLAAILASVGDHLVVTPTGAGAGEAATGPDPHTATSSPPNGSSDLADDVSGAGQGEGDGQGVDDGARAGTEGGRPPAARTRPGPDRQRGRSGPRGEADGRASQGRLRRGPGRRRGGSGPRGEAGGRAPEGRRRRWERRVLVAAAVVVVVTAIGITVAPVRRAVAGWLGIGATDVVRVGVGEGDPGDLPFLGDDLAPVDRSTAERRLGDDLPDTSDTALGTAPVLAVPPEGGVILAWDDGATTLWVRPIEQPAAVTVSKLLTYDDRLERIDDLGDAAAIVEGPHVLGTPQRRLAAGTVLVWVDGGFEHRLESDLDPGEMLEIARTISPG